MELWGIQGTGSSTYPAEALDTYSLRISALRFESTKRTYGCFFTGGGVFSSFFVSASSPNVIVVVDLNCL